MHPDEICALSLSDVAAKIARRDLSPAMVDHAWPRLTFTSAIDQAAIQKLVDAGVLKPAEIPVPELQRIAAFAVRRAQACRYAVCNHAARFACTPTSTRA